MPANNFRFEGFKEVQQILDALPKKLGPKVISGIMRSAAKPLIERGRELAPKDDGDLRASLGVLAGRGAGRGSSVYVGPRRSEKYKGYAAHLIEYGTAPRKTESGKSTGSTPARPFWRPAFDQTKDEIIERIRKNLRLVLDSDFRNVDFDTGKLLPEASDIPGGPNGGGNTGKGKRQRGPLQTGRKGGTYYIGPSGRKIYIKRS
ncbi:HK97-gp10 family putative phage morphogenesis protein [Hymenobacter guriensis]|uniref:HK97 gp10 family phage protein n=1 Tax=Hymenobacter guriensis TaxID=2793065 RepID=A0ABS0KWW4_9BACT|nr:HK97-gp10 family putative phage morphogenesis protein [Hymenobacter guriensis]MBG8552354.1 HK97 gp10 family phage protein [Hymenobacter guriensis]